MLRPRSARARPSSESARRSSDRAPTDGRGPPLPLRYPAPSMSHVLANFVTMLAAVVSLLVLVRVVLSWTNADGGGGFTAFVYQATEPLLGPIRRVLPPMGGFDWSPFIAIIALSLVAGLAGGPDQQRPDGALDRRGRLDAAPGLLPAAGRRADGPIRPPLADDWRGPGARGGGPDAGASVDHTRDPAVARAGARRVRGSGRCLLQSRLDRHRAGPARGRT